MWTLLWRISSFLVFVAGLILGAGVLLWAKNIGIFSYEIPHDAPYWKPGKQVGFGFGLAWNWTFSLILMPITAALAIIVVQRSRYALLRLHGKNMLVDNTVKPIARETVDRIWRGMVIAGAVFTVVLGVLSVLSALDQYEDVIGRHFAAGEFVHLENLPRTAEKLYPPTELHEYDWSVAALIGKDSVVAEAKVNRDKNEAFSRFVYIVYLGLFMTAFFALVGWLIVMAATASLTLHAEPGIRLMPDAKDKDPRRGFEVLENTFLFSLVAVFVAYFAAYLAVVQNIYLRTEHESFGDLFLIALADAADRFAAVENGDVVRFALVAVGWTVEDHEGKPTVDSVDVALASMAGVVVILIVMGVAILMLHVVAKNGHARLAEHRGEAPKRIDTWPMSWPKVVTLMMALFLATVALFLFRLEALLFLGILLLALVRMWIESRPKRAAAAPADGEAGGGTASGGS